ncbi:MAG: histidinol-phosphate transaminase [Planctomycetota bacterium]|jgi:histidinol-phosphate aminotransferase|nr:histidinol-phosphate transaminase [Planctomycetota bacterium]
MGIIRACVEKMTGYLPGEMSIDPRTVKLNQNENRHPPSPRVAEAIAGALGGLNLYPESTSRSLRRAAAELYGVSERRVMATNGSDEMLSLFFRCCCSPGDEAVGFHPGYTYYATLAAMNGVRYRPIDFSGEFRLPERLELEPARLVLLANPNSPTGTLFPEGEIRRLLAAAGNGLVVIDEAYADFSGQTSIPLLDEYPNLAVVRTLSKSHSLAGLRVGLGFARPEPLAQFEKVRDFYNLDRLAQAGAEAALRDRDWLRRTVERIVASRERTARGIAGLGLKVYPSAANFLFFRCPGDSGAERISASLRERNILVRHFGNRGISDCLRVSIGTEADMDLFLAGLEKAVRKG